LRGKGVGRAAITCSIFTLDPPRANAHSHRTRSNFASEEYKVHLRMQQQNASAIKSFAPRNGTSLILPTNLTDAASLSWSAAVYPPPSPTIFIDQVSRGSATVARICPSIEPAPTPPAKPPGRCDKLTRSFCLHTQILGASSK
jgi:hypothetical protein